MDPIFLFARVLVGGVGFSCGENPIIAVDTTHPNATIGPTARNENARKASHLKRRDMMPVLVVSSQLVSQFPATLVWHILAAFGLVLAVSLWFTLVCTDLVCWACAGSVD